MTFEKNYKISENSKSLKCFSVFWYKSNKNNKTSSNKETSKKTESSKVIISAFSTINSSSNYNLILDSGATEHYTPIKEWLLDYKTIVNKTINIANGLKVPIEGIGNIPIILGNRDVLIISLLI